MTWAPLRELRHTDPLTAVELLGCAAIAAVPGSVLALTKAAGRRRLR